MVAGRAGKGLHSRKADRQIRSKRPVKAAANGNPGSPVSRRTSAQLVKEVLEQDDGVVWSCRFRCRDGERDGEPLAVHARGLSATNDSPLTV